MSPTHTQAFSIREFPTLDITCAQCGSIVKIPLPKTELALHAACMGCNSPFWDGEGNPFRLTVLGMLRSLSRCHESNAEARFKLGFSLVSPVSSSRDV